MNWRAYLELMRVSNLPTVWTDAIVGLFAGYAAGLIASGMPPAAAGTALLLRIVDHGFVLLVSLSALYLGGMVLNDLLDVHVDRLERPRRPIPSGRVTEGAAWTLAGALFAIGVLGLVVYTNRATLFFGLLLLLAIVLYDLLHRRFPTSVFLMGACRGLVYMTAGAAAAPAGMDATWYWLVAPFALAAFLYVTLITVVSRFEVGSTLGRARWVPLLMIPVALSPAAVVGPQRDAWLPTLVTAGIVVFWLSRGAFLALATPPRVGPAILTWLSGLCLLDAFFLSLLAQPAPAVVAIGCWAVTGLLHRVVSGT